MALDILSAIFLGLVQGFTEWLPVSSSGHLVVSQALLGIDVPPEFDIAIMAGTIAALLIYFRGKIIWIARGLLKFDKAAVDYAILIIAAGVPTAIIGLAGKSFFKGLFASPFSVSLLIVVTGLFLYAASAKKMGEKKLAWPIAAVVGIAQGIAVAPGISRSGSTIGAAMLLGIKPAEAAEFSFIIGIPAMSVATAVEIIGVQSAGVGMDALAAGIVAAFAAGYASIGFFMRLIGSGKLHYFAYYCIGAGLLFAALTFGKI